MGFLSPVYNFLYGQSNKQQSNQGQWPLDAKAAWAQDWMGQDGIENPFPQNQPKPPGFIERAQGVAENITSPIGAARKSIFDFAGVPEDQREGNAAPNMQAPQLPATQMQSMANPAQNKQIMQVYQQMMQAIKQKRGF